MELTFLLTWIACLLSYSASNNQKLLHKATNKLFAWTGFIGLLFLAVWVATTQQSIAISLLYVLGLIMTFWVVIIILHSHIQSKKLPSAIGILMVVSVVLNIGGEYVT